MGVAVGLPFFYGWPVSCDTPVGTVTPHCVYGCKIALRTRRLMLTVRYLSMDEFYCQIRLIFHRDKVLVSCEEIETRLLTCLAVQRDIQIQGVGQLTLIEAGTSQRLVSTPGGKQAW